MEQIYCSVSEITEDLGQTGLSEAAVLGKIQAASQNILVNLGQFLPVSETRYFEGECGEDELLVPPLLSVASITNAGASLAASDYILEPNGRHWRNGPYSQVELADLGSQAAWSELDHGVAILGNWGMYEETASLGLTVSQLVGDTTLVVSDGGKVSPGMVLLIGSEWELVTGTGAATASTASLAGALDDSTEEITITNGALVQAGERFKLGFEICQALDVSGNVVLAARGINGSKRAAHVTGTAVMVYRTYTVSRGVNGSTAAAHSSVSVLRQVAPADVNYLCRQIAALMIKKAQTAYVGRAGNDETGTGFFVNEFPRNQIEAVKKNYFWGGV